MALSADPSPSAEAQPARAPRLAPDRSFYTIAGAIAALIVFAGFARTYYLKFLYGAPPITLLVHAHGATMTLWLALFITQARLVAVRRVDIHKKLGMAGAVLAVLILVVGYQTSIVAAQLNRYPGPDPLRFLPIPLVDLLVFLILVGSGLAWRKKPDIHRRLLLLATVGSLSPATSRLPFAFVQNGGPLVFFGLTDLVVLGCVAYDTWRNRRLHPAFAAGTALIILSQPFRLWLAGTDAWMSLARWLVG